MYYFLLLPIDIKGLTVYTININMKTYRVMYTEKEIREETPEFTRKAQAMKFALKRKKEGCTEIIIDIYAPREDMGGNIDYDDIVWVDYIHI